MLERAIDAAAEADAVVLVVGTDGEWESEGDDRPSMDLPGDQDELIRRVAGRQPRARWSSLNAASPVTMDWADDARAILHVWLGGQEMAPALAEVLLGDAEPAGRLPTTIPLRLEHNPSYGNFPGENGHVRYGEGVLVGYRWYEARHLPVRFPFGHGGSYTTFSLGRPRGVGRHRHRRRSAHAAGRRHQHGRAPGRRGRPVLRRAAARPGGPPAEGAGRVRQGVARPRRDGHVELALDERAFAYWDPGLPERDELAARATAVPMAGGRGERPPPGWRVDPGRHVLHLGTSSAAVSHSIDVEVVAPPAE